MPPPMDYSSRVGAPRVWQRDPTENWEEDSDAATGKPFRTVMEVGVGSRNESGYAVLALNRDPIIRGDAPEAQWPPDRLIAIAYKVPDESQKLIFEGYLDRGERSLSPTHDAGSPILRHAIHLWDADTYSICRGRFAPRMRGNSAGSASLVHETGLPLVFNPRGRPNRSLKTMTDTLVNGESIFADNSQSGDAPRGDVHYFVDDEGWDVVIDNDGTFRRARCEHWTFASALAYVLHFHAWSRARPNWTYPEIRNGVAVWFGYPPSNDPPGEGRRSQDEDTLWGAIIGIDRSSPIYKLPANDESTGGEQPPQGLSLLPAELLARRCNNIDIQGMSVYEALGTLLHAAGLGWWIDTFIEFDQFDSVPPDPLEHIFRVWSPGGKLNSDFYGLGEIYQLKLEDYSASSRDGSGNLRTAADILSKNTCESIHVVSDGKTVCNAPIIHRAPTLYEITAELRPLWKPLHSQQNGYFDNVNPNADVSDPGNPAQNEQKVAAADIHGAFLQAIANPEIYDSGPSMPMQRRKNLASMLWARGKHADKFYDIGRKWGLPLDRSYPHDEFARAEGLGDPTYYADYSPLNFDAVDQGDMSSYGVLMTPIQGAGAWPTRRRPMLPCLTQDRNGESVGIIVEISFDGGENWTQWTAFRVADDECALWLTYESPFDVVNPRIRDLSDSNRHKHLNLAMAHIYHLLRVRATFTIEGSPLKGSDGIPIGNEEVGLPFDPSTLPRARFFDRTRRYGKHVILSKFKDQVAEKPDDLFDPNTDNIENI